ncbi:hypothetical protein CHARACLAT_005631 [Characodon lateralis]|uniref:Uncharacterized protein n=1 Tax=Characodon lateralis TaxID=208331 RepID=A0ABU7DYJ4_9TELE|nr:hypothetical protein [Characodon lateralis]
MTSAVANRAIGAIVGSAVADAAAQPLHWLYDLQKLKGILAQDPNPEFRSESANPFYRRQTGQQSCYGDQAYVLLESLSECGGLNADDLKQRTLKFFGQVQSMTRLSMTLTETVVAQDLSCLLKDHGDKQA